MDTMVRHAVGPQFARTGGLFLFVSRNASSHRGAIARGDFAADGIATKSKRLRWQRISLSFRGSDKAALEQLSINALVCCPVDSHAKSLQLGED